MKFREIWKKKSNKQPLWCGYDGIYQNNHILDFHTEKWFRDLDGTVVLVDYCDAMEVYRIYNKKKYKEIKNKTETI